MATPATARALERGNALLRRDSAKSLTAKKGRSMASPINAQQVTRAHATPFDIDVPKTSVGQYGWTEGGKKPEAWAKFIHIGSDGGFDSTHGAAGGLTADFLDRYIFRAN